MILKIIRKYFLHVFVFGFLFSLAFILWSGKSEELSYKKMACSFEKLPLNCVDTIKEWNDGLAFFDRVNAQEKNPLVALKKLLWEYWNIEFIGESKASTYGAILPLQVLKNKQSGCMGLSWLALMVAESRNLPLNAILLPNHVFLRYGNDDGRVQFGISSKTINLEPNRQGFTYSNEEYRKKYKDKRWSGFEFKPLLPKEFIGLAAFDMGNLYLDSDISKALVWYRLAEEFFSDYKGIKVNQEIAKNRLDVMK